MCILSVFYDGWTLLCAQQFVCNVEDFEQLECNGQ